MGPRLGPRIDLLDDSLLPRRDGVPAGLSGVFYGSRVLLDRGGAYPRRVAIRELVIDGFSVWPFHNSSCRPYQVGVPPNLIQR